MFKDREPQIIGNLFLKLIQKSFYRQKEVFLFFHCLR